MDGDKNTSYSPQAPASPTRSAAELAGTWKLSLWHPSHGTIVANLHLEESGHGEYRITATDLNRSGYLRVIAWDGEWLEARAAGVRQRLRAILQGAILYVELPWLGQVKVIRQSPHGGTRHFSGS